MHNQLLDQLLWKAFHAGVVEWDSLLTTNRILSIAENPHSVFISYSWDSSAYKSSILQIAGYLVENGFDVVLDQTEKLADPAEVLTAGIMCRNVLLFVTPFYLHTCVDTGLLKKGWGSEELEYIDLNHHRFDKIITVHADGSLCFYDYPIIDIKIENNEFAKKEILEALQGEWSINHRAVIEPCFIIDKQGSSRVATRSELGSDYASSIKLFSLRDSNNQLLQDPILQKALNDEEFRKRASQLRAKRKYQDNYKKELDNDKLVNSLLKRIPIAISSDEAAEIAIKNNLGFSQLNRLFGTTIARKTHIHATFIKYGLIYSKKAEQNKNLQLSCLVDMGEELIGKGQYDKAIDYFEKALADNLENSGSEHVNVRVCWKTLGAAWDGKGESYKAIDFYEKALASDLRNLGPENPDVAMDLNKLGNVWAREGQTDKAIDYYEKALACYLRADSEVTPYLASVYRNLGAAWDSKGEFDKAIDYFEKALASNLRSLGPEHLNVAIDRNNLGLAWIKKEQYSKASDYFEKAFSIVKDKLGDDHSLTNSVRDNMKFVRIMRLAQIAGIDGHDS